MIPSSAIRLRATLTAALVATLLSVAACAPSPHTTPSPTATPLFANKEDAFAAAEATLSEYVEALNAVDTTNPDTFEPLFKLSSGTVEKSDRKNFSTMHADRQVLSGSTKVLTFQGLESRLPFTTVEAAICLDVSAVRITNADGSSGVSPDRPSVYALTVEFVAAGEGRYTVDRATPTEDVSC
ncbi:hypothetical protein [Microbacterium sufflavum]|uniref:Nuclear transport factor 2 family protein n=1 Tax=Microbacterium sufflavum TaxID=2851649 RepID=A0ABY4IKI1_9MICO|nr:hypothetical protein [Microbacterium sufflavum]UPL12441.1 hypothetical protein KV394_15570 [Microbacterium sufflavum]